MQHRRLAVAFAIAGLAAQACASPPPRTLAAVGAPAQDNLVWRILSVEDRSVESVTRFRYKVEVSRLPTRSEAERVSREIIRAAPPHHGLEVLFYRQGSDPSGAWTAGRATWWPNGRPGDAVRFDAGDYTAHRLGVQLGDASPAAAPPVSESAGVPTELRQRIYGEILVLEGRGVAHDVSVAQVAQHHGLSTAAVEEISWEGVTRGWPLP